MGRREDRGFEGGVIADPAATWLAFLASPEAPKTALSRLGLDVYLTGIIVSPHPAPIRPSRWLGGLWGQDEPVFEDEKQINLVLGAVMGHYNALIKEIDRSLKRLEAGHACDYRPMFLPDNGKPPHDAVRDWVRGFWKAMALAPEAWRALAGVRRSWDPSSVSSSSKIGNLSNSATTPKCFSMRMRRQFRKPFLPCVSSPRVAAGQLRPPDRARSVGTIPVPVAPAASTSSAAA